MDRSGVPCLVIECAFGDEPFELPESPFVIRRRSASVLWQKERLLNLVLDRLPPSCRKIAWIDADVLFENPAWHIDCSQLLDRYNVAQLFDTAVWLPRGHAEYRGEGQSWPSFCCKYLAKPECLGQGWLQHGHTGFAWAARRETLESCGFFDLCLTGSADHLMSHGFVGDVRSRCIEALIGLDTPLHRHYVSWARRAYRASGAKLGFLPGRVLHLWHGDFDGRNYHQHSQEFRSLHFNPSTDVRLASNGCWEWTGANPAVQRWASALFADRKEDDGRC